VIIQREFGKGSDRLRKGIPIWTLSEPYPNPIRTLSEPYLYIRQKVSRSWKI